MTTEKPLSEKVIDGYEPRRKLYLEKDVAEAVERLKRELLILKYGMREEQIN